MRSFKHIVLIVTVVMLAISCEKQRDLYSVSSPLLYIEGDWVPSLGMEDMRQNATAMIYDKDSLIEKEYFFTAKSTSAKLSTGIYDVIILNGLLYSATDTHLDNIYFKNIESLSTFEAFGNEVTANKRLSRVDEEIIISNEMEILTSGSAESMMEGNQAYYLKYHNGKNGYPDIPDYVESSIYITPYAVSYEAKVKVNLVNPSSAAVANGALRGFAGSVFMSSRMPSHQAVTHHLRLNSLQITHPGTPGDPTDPERGTIESPVFVTFGPPLDLPQRMYEFELSIILIDGSIFNKTYDITSYIEPVITEIYANLTIPAPLQIEINIPIEIIAVLPKIEIESGSIGVDDWGEDEIIRVPIK